MHEMKKWLEEKENAMRQWLEETEKTIVAVSFAETGKQISEKDVARIRLIRSNENEDFSSALQRIFAEAGDPDLTVKRLSEVEVQISGASLETFLETVGLKGVRVKYLIAAI